MITPEQQRWKEVEYSRSKIIKSGKIIKDPTATVEGKIEAIRVIDNWRAAHAFPMHVIYMHLRRMAENPESIVVAERLKRLDSIIKKLEREPTMSLWTMQDLGGCRFIVPSIEEVYYYANKYDKSRKRHIYKDQSDYIRNPKESGYRSLHMVYEYHSDTVDKYNRNLLIEIQYRTHLQHLWATAVETVGLFRHEPIKAGQGDKDFIRFFQLVSSLFALQENSPIIPGTTADRKKLVNEIIKIDKKHHILDMLGAVRVAVYTQEQMIKNAQGYYILILNYDQKRLSVKYYKPSQIETANRIYGEIEQSKTQANIDAVLVRVSSFQTLKKAYPNYFSDIGEFLTLLAQYIE